MCRSALLFVLAILLPAVAWANDGCGPRDQITASLKEKFHEAPTSGGINTDGNLVTVFQSADGHTWTVLLVSPKGNACIVATGENWIDKTAPADGPGL